MDMSQPKPPKNTDATTPEAEHEEPSLNFKRDVVDRRTGLDRRRATAQEAGYTGPERRAEEPDRRSGLERRRGAGIRREEERRSAEEGEMTPEQFEFIRAVETYKRVNHKLFPTWTEVLEVMLQLGYRKVEPRDIDLPNVPEPTLYRPDSREQAA
jgi:hypothetical protein